MAIITVTNTNDSGAGSLRAAVTSANALSNADTIVFAAGLAGQTITLTTGELILSNDVTIDGDVNGDDKADITISGNNNDRIFKVFDQVTPSTDVDLKSLTLTNGSALGFDFNQDDDGGAIYMRGKTLDIIDCTIKDSAANYGGGGLDINSGSVRIVNSLFTGNSANDYGGAIRNFSGDALSLTNSTLSGNTSAGAGGIFDFSSGTLRLDSSTVVNNTGGSGITTGYGTTKIINSVVAGNGPGGAAPGNDIGGTVTIANHSFFGTAETITTNIGSINGGGNAQLGTLADNGGTVLTHAPLSGSALIDAGNNAILPKDLLDIDGDANTTETLPEDGRGEGRVINGTTDIGAVESNLIIVTTAADTVDAGDGLISLREAVALANGNANASSITFAASLAGQTLVLAGGNELALTGDVTIDGDTNGDNKADITISGGDASRIFSISGAATDVDLLSLTLRDGNTAGAGGAINAAGGTLDIRDSTFQDNQSLGQGGALSLDTTVVTITNSLITGNSAQNYGGGVYATSSSVTLTNSTVHANTSTSFGGGISANSTTVTLLNSTVTANRADADGANVASGGGIDNFGGNLTVTNSVVADNLSGNGSTENDIAGDVTTATNSVFGTAVTITGGSGNLTGVANVRLGELLDNGGTVLTRSPLDGSVLIGAGNNASLGPDTFDLDGDGDTLEALPLDGRGGVRVVGGTVDAGAVEQIVAETIRGTEAANTILGGLGIDQLFGLGGADILNGGAGRDTMAGGDGSDTYFADLFNDVALEASAVLATGGNDLVVFGGLAGTFTLGLNVERLTLGGAAAINGRGNGLANTMTGNGAANALAGLGGADRLNGGAGRDVMAGGDGSDTYFADLFNDVVQETNAALATGGNDLVNFTGVAGIFTLGLNVERLTLGGAAAISGRGNGLANTLTGNGAANTLIGGLGGDKLTGGAGSDLFDFNAITESTVATAGLDTITDFNETATDRIDLSTIDANSVLGGNNAFTFIGAGAFTGLGQIRAFANGGNTVVDINTTGTNAADMRILLTGLHVLDAADFVL